MLFTSNAPRLPGKVLSHQQHTLNHRQVALMNKTVDA